jgi:hypothetical protein
MSTENRSKINQLINQWPRGTVSATSALLSMGFSNELIRRYKNSRWIKPIGRGVYALYGDQVEWTGGLHALQTQLGLTVHAGGIAGKDNKSFWRTALK